MTDKSILEWLLQGDPSVRWQVQQDLLKDDEKTIRDSRLKIAREGWGYRLLKLQDENHMWSGKLYSPKWTSTTYTLLLLRRLGLDPDNQQAQKGSMVLLDEGFYDDGGINFWKSWNHSETCVTGMILSILAYFNIRDERLMSMAGHLLNEQMTDGGWNCQKYKGATHSSFHTTISVLEGFYEYLEKFHEHRSEMIRSRDRAIEFLLEHRLYKSHRTGRVVNDRMTRFHFPPRWYYDVMRVLDYFQKTKIDTDSRMEDAVDLVYKKRTPEGVWDLPARYGGKVFFELETTGKPSRWNTLRALRVLKWWEDEE
jgi:hypothetical protein